MKFSVYFFLIFAFVIEARAQDAFTRYEWSFPASVRPSPNERSQIALALQAKHRIHPELVYYYVIFYRRAIGDTTVFNGMPLKEVNDHIEWEESRYLNRRKMFCRNLIHAMDALTIEPDQRDAFFAILSPYMLERASSAGLVERNLTVDSTKMQFLAWQGYVNGSVVTYDSTIDYATLRKAREEQLRTTLLHEAEAAIVMDEHARMDMVERLVKGWFLFESPDGSTPTEAFSLIGRLIEQRQVPELLPAFHIGIVWQPMSSRISAKTDLPLPRNAAPLTIDQHYAGGSTGISAGYRVYFDHALGRFSFVDIQLVAFHTYTNQTLNSPEGYTDRVITGATFREAVLTRLGGSSTITSHMRILAGLNTPLLRIYGRHYIELGCYAGAARTQLKVDYNYRYLVKTGEVVGGNLHMTNYTLEYMKSPDGGTESAKWQTIVSPWLGVVVQLTRRFSVEPMVSLTGGYLAVNYYF